MLDTGLQGVRVKRSKRVRGPFFQEIKQILEQRMEEGYMRRYEATILVDILVGFQRWIFETYVVLEEEELPQYEEMFVEWLANALLADTTSEL